MIEDLVTGGAGFIGSNLAARLVAERGAVRVLDDLTTGHRENLGPLGAAAELRVGCVTDAAILADAMRGIRRVFHLAAMVAVERTVREPVEAERVNAVGTLRVLEAAHAAGVERVVFASSAAVYGDDPSLPKRETMRPEPISPYGVTKLAGEHYLRFFAREHGLRGVSLRFFNVFGPRQDPRSPYAAAIPRFLDALLDGRPPEIFGDGRQTRDFCPVEDVVDACLRAAAAPGVGAGEAFNVGRGAETDLLQLLEWLAEGVGRAAEPRFSSPRPGDIRRSVADVSLARERLGFAPAEPLGEALARTARWYREHRR
ncbi:MAG: NAD-dependent epimerase/dehydratase family protein [Deltaproteobacteria bacterium]|nr:NAD-dependent epimerase/dehydratase family protein [Deltaproteobacteria bacterium]